VELLTHVREFKANNADLKKAAQEATAYKNWAKTQIGQESISVSMSMRKSGNCTVWQVCCQALTPEGNKFILAKQGIGNVE
jgi:hypothetical protein